MDCMDNNPHVVSLSKLLDENHLVTKPDHSNISNILVVVNKSLFNEDLEKITSFFSNKAAVKFTFTHVENIDKESKKSLYDAILSGVIGDNVPCNLDLFSAYTELLISGGTLIVKTENNNEEKLFKSMKMCGFLNVTANKISGIVVGNTPTYKIGSSDKVILNSETKENVISAWKLDDNNSETISEDDLLEADDLKKPVPSSLRVCATTKKAKACKDCSCGLAEELEAASKLVASKPDTSNAKSSCGSCYLGDAFRCASCPYLGMPAFKPGEKVQLAGNLLQDDF